MNSNGEGEGGVTAREWEREERGRKRVAVMFRTWRQRERGTPHTSVKNSLCRESRLALSPTWRGKMRSEVLDRWCLSASCEYVKLCRWTFSFSVEFARVNFSRNVSLELKNWEIAGRMRFKCLMSLCDTFARKMWGEVGIWMDGNSFRENSWKCLSRLLRFNILL